MGENLSKRIASGLKTAVILVAVIVLPLSAFGQAKDVRCNNCVDQSDIAKSAVSTNRLKNNAVTSGKIRNGTIKKADMSEGAQPAGAAFSESGNGTSLESTDVTVNSVTLDLPGRGIVVVYVGGYARFDSSPADAYCAIRKDSSSIGGEWRVSGSNANPSSSRIPNASTRAFSETGGIVTYNLNCREITGEIVLFSPWINAIFVPQNFSTNSFAGFEEEYDASYVDEPLDAEDLY